MHSNIPPPHTFPRRILLATVGLNPQVVTETLFALAVLLEPAFVPTEIHIVTTVEGAKRTELMLLDRSTAKLAALARDYGLEGLDEALTRERIHVIGDETTGALDDITDEVGSVAAANRITDVVRTLTLDDDAAIHVSIAGGRKTMGFLLGSALTLFGRSQDRLSHVLVSEPFEQHPEFFFPPRDPAVLFTRDKPPRPMTTADAQILLAEIPFVQMRRGLPHDLLSGKASYSEVVASAQASVVAPELIIDLDARCITCHGAVVGLPPQLLALYALLAEDRLDRGTGFHWSLDGAREAFIASYARISGIAMREIAGLRKRLNSGDDEPLRKLLQQAKSNLNRRLREALGLAAEPYLVQTSAYENMAGSYKFLMLTLPRQVIRFAATGEDGA